MNLPKKFVQMRLIIHCKNFEAFNFLVEYVGDLLHSKPWISARSVWSRNNQFLCTLYQTQGSLDCLLKRHLRKRMKAISCRQSYFNDFCKGLYLGTCSLHSAHTVTILWHVFVRPNLKSRKSSMFVLNCDFKKTFHISVSRITYEVEEWTE